MHVNFTGRAAGPILNEGGSGSNFLCLPGDPEWGDSFGGDKYIGRIGGIEYEFFNNDNNVFDESNTGGIALADHPVPCALCYVNRNTAVMIPAKRQCPDGWTVEYDGYLASEGSSDATRKRSSYVCCDRAPEITDGATIQNNAILYPVAAVCGTLPCSIYPTGKEMTCVVCSK